MLTHGSIGCKRKTEMKFTYDSFSTFYLNDLALPDTYHERTRPKVSNIDAWKAIGGAAGVAIDPYSIDGRDVWIWSDIHFGHRNIIKYTEPHRPFSSPEEMDAALIYNYNSVVKQDDIVLWCGDITFKSVTATNDILRSLPGYKVWIVGNHDMDRKGNVHALAMNERHLSLPITIEKDGRTFQLLLTHYPLSNVPPGCINVHGHIHQHVATDKHINVCVEHTGCKPINLRDVADRAYGSLFQ